MLERFKYALAHNGLAFLGVLTFGAVINLLLATLDPLILKVLIDEGLVAGNFRLFVVLAAAVVVFGVVIRVGVWGFELLAQKLRNKVAETLSLQLLGAFYQIDFLQTKQRESGYFLSRIYDEPAKVAQGVVGTWIGLVTQFLSLLGAAAVTLYLSWKITVLLLAVVPPLYYLANRFGPRITQASKAENEEEANLREGLAHAVDAYTTVQVFSLFDTVHRRIGGQVRKFLDVLFSRVKAAKTFQMYSSISMSLAEAVVLLVAGYGVITGWLTIGGLFAFMSAFWKVIGAASGLVGLMPELSKLDGYIERLVEFEGSARPREETDSEPIEIDGVTAGYDGHTVFRDMTLRIRQGEKVLIVGPNGSGKSTLAYLMTQLLRPERGVVNAPRLERVSALLSPFHFVPGTLKDNVGFDRLSDEKKEFFQELVQVLDLADKVDKDPSTELSQGQKKKAQIIMTLLKDADVYIFDEPLANVDSESKRQILQYQIDRAEGKTLISIMHGDEEYVSLFDRVVPLARLTTEPAETEPVETAPAVAEAATSASEASSS